MTTWTKKDEKTARAVLRKIAEAVGSWQALANLLRIESRATTHKWQTRGRVPVQYCAALARIARENSVTLPGGGEVTASLFNPGARALALDDASQVAA